MIEMDIGLVTALMFGVLILLLMTGLPVSFCMGGAAVVFTILVLGPESLRIFTYASLSTQQNYSLVCIPGFLFTGVIMQYSGIADELFALTYKWLGGIKGGLAMGVIIICAVFAAIVGVSGAATCAMAVIAIPAMMKRGYDKQLALGTVQAGGALGILIPPSVTFALYGVVADVSIGRLFVAGIFPGLLLVILFIIYILVRSHLQPNLAPAIPYEERTPWKDRISSIKVVVWPILLIFVVMGLVFLGVTTATEASGVGAVGAIIVAAIHRRLNWDVIRHGLMFTLRMFGMIAWILISAKAFSSIYCNIGAIGLMEEYVAVLNLSPLALVIAMISVWFIMGFFLEAGPILFITGPLFLPIAAGAGVDLIYFGALYVMLIETALLTPPIGFNLFYMKGICTAPDFEIKGITLPDIYRSVYPYVSLQIVAIILVLLFPQIATWLPSKGFVF